jgi:ABC-type enterochelin transport system permease subunit
MSRCFSRIDRGALATTACITIWIALAPAHDLYDAAQVIGPAVFFGAPVLLILAYAIAASLRRRITLIGFSSNVTILLIAAVVLYERLLHLSADV